MPFISESFPVLREQITLVLLTCSQRYLFFGRPMVALVNTLMDHYCFLRSPCHPRGHCYLLTAALVGQNQIIAPEVQVQLRLWCLVEVCLFTQAELMPMNDQIRKPSYWHHQLMT